MQLLIDVMCGDLVSYCRMCGHDTAYAGDRGLEADDDLLAVARAEDRTIVTRDVTLAERADESILLESKDTKTQLQALFKAGVDLRPSNEPRICGRCNGPLEPVSEDAAVPTYVPDSSTLEVWRCRDCSQHFWKGSHWDRVTRTLEAVCVCGRTDE